MSQASEDAFDQWAAMPDDKRPPLNGETESPSIAAEAPAVLTGGDTGVVSETVDSTQDLFSLSIPKIGAYRTQDHRYYFNGEGPYPGVTSILSVIDKPALVQWAKATVAGIAVDRWEEVGARIQKEGADDTRRWLSGLPDYQRDTAAKLGSGVHLLADMAARDETAFELSEEEKPYLQAFRDWLSWLKAQGGEIVSSEKMVWSEDGYAGTYDLLVRLNGNLNHQLGVENELWLLDIKTSKGYYAEYALQLIAYGTADYIILEGNPTPYPMPIPQRYGVLHLRPDLYTDTGWRLVEYPLIPSDRMAFLGCLELWRWKEQKRYTKSALAKASVTVTEAKRG